MYQHINLGFTKPKLHKAAFKAAKAYNYDDHSYDLDKLDHHKRCWIEVGGQTNWGRHLYNPSSNYRQMTNILSKAFNYRKRNGRMWKDKQLVPRENKKLREQIRNKTGFSAHRSQCSPSIYHVMEDCHARTREFYMMQRQCDCDKWQISGVPCVLAITVLAEKTPPRYKRYVHEFYTVERYRASYVTKWPA
ncbi:hypothetical protein MKX01_002967 [Papaver californicum]|nr:hypothetical protein MKX01_002967 [Papaver californicum]